MRAFVFTDAALTSEAGRFVWLEINSEKADNAAFLRRYPIPALPTFLILDPADGHVALRWVGGATVPQLAKLLDDGRAAVRGAHTAQRAAGPVERAYAMAESLYGAGADSAAVPAYEEALHRAPAGWPHRTHAIESLLFALAQTGANERAATLAIETLPAARHSSSAGNIVASGLDAALELPGSAPGRAAMVAE